MLNKLIVLLLALLLVPRLLLGAVNGKVRGKVTDRETGDALPGANIVIEGTTLGAASDVDGEYMILNVPPGAYSVKAAFIGYRDVVIANAIVNADLTTELNFELPSEAIEVATITIVAEQPIVIRNATNAVRIVRGEEIKTLPIRGLQSVAVLQPGVVFQAGDLYIRGSRPTEVGYFLEGATTRNIRTGFDVVTVIPEALEQFQIQAGGYNAEFGGANAGIINNVLRSGGPDYHFTFQAETDQFPGQDPLKGDKVLDTYSYGYSDLVFTMNGPVPAFNKKMRFFLAGERQFDRDRFKRFWEPFRFENIIDNGLEGGPEGDTLMVNGSPDYEFNGGALPASYRNRWTGNGTLTYDAKPFKFRLAGTFTWRRQQNQESIYGRTGPSSWGPLTTLANTERAPKQDLSNGLLNFKMTHLLGKSSFYEFNATYFDHRQKTYDPIFKDNFLLYADSTANAAKGFQFDTATDDPPALASHGFAFQRRGSIRTSYLKQKQNYFRLAADFTHQARSHELKFGAKFRRHTVRNFSGVGGIITGSILNRLRLDPELAAAYRNKEWDNSGLQLLFRSSATPNNYGYDIFGNEIDKGIDAPKHPKFFSIYLQDKYEINDLVINVGVRYDRFDTDDRIFRNVKDPGFSTATLTLDPDELVKVDPYDEISPRLGIGFPVTDKTVFHLQFGKFVQMPELNRAYHGSATATHQFIGGFFFPEPIGFAIEPVKTTQYEIGFSQQFTDNAAFDATLFYRDIKGQIQTRRIFPEAGSAASFYDVYTNGDFTTTKGVEFRMTMRRTQHLAGWFNYTLCDARGTGSYINQASASLDQGTNQIEIITPLYFSQRHQGSLSLDYRYGLGEGGPILSGLGANLLFTFNSGHPYTLSTGGLGQNHPQEGGLLFDRDARNRRPLESIGASTTPWVYNVDLRVDKTVRFSDLDLNFYVYVQNLLNTQNTLNVYPRTGNSASDGFLANPDLSGTIIAAPENGPQYVEFYRTFNDLNRNHYIGLQTGGAQPTDLDLWGTPRQIRFGLRIEY